MAIQQQIQRSKIPTRRVSEDPRLSQDLDRVLARARKVRDRAAAQSRRAA